MRTAYFLLSLIIVLSACTPLKQAYELEQNPDLRFVMLQSSQMYDVIADQTLSDKQKEQFLIEKFNAGMARWKTSKVYGRLFNQHDFNNKPGALYSAMVNFYNGQNEIAKSIPYYNMAAQEALDNDLYGIYLEYQHLAHDAYIKLGDFERATYILQKMSDNLNEFFAVNPAKSPDNYDVYSLFYYQYINDLKLNAQLKSDIKQDASALKGRFEYRQRAQQLFPALKYMMLSTQGYEVKLMGGKSAHTTYTEQTDELRSYAYAFAMVGNEKKAYSLLAKITEIYQKNIHSMEADSIRAYSGMVMKGARAGGLAMASSEQIDEAMFAAQRHGARSQVWQYWDKAIINFELSEYNEGYTAILEAVKHFSVVDDIYSHLPQSYINVDNINADKQAVTLLQAQLEEQLGKNIKAALHYQSVIEWTERTRDSMPIEQRKYFFESFAKKAYLGRVRALVGSYQSKNASINELISATEAFRSRQLKELLDSPVEAGSTLDSIQNTLTAHEGIIALTDLDSHLLTLWLSKDSYQINYSEKPANWDDHIKKLRSQLVEERVFNIAEYRKLSKPLFGSLINDIKKSKRIFVVTDGSLSLLPANILPLGDDLLQTGRVISYLPSITMLRRDHETKQTNQQLLALGDPVYSPESRISKEDKGMLLATRGSSELGGFLPLPETRTEVESIAQYFGRNSQILLGKGASESVLKQMDLSNFSHLHFATHGVIEGEIPELKEPALVLSYEDDEDGFLSASEVANLKLNADITVLSACNTGSGEYFRGEGVMGLGRAFMVAGSRNVVVSLWPVDSVATEQLMVSFYKELSLGVDAASALSKAQSKLRQSKGGNSIDRGLKRAKQNAQTEGYNNPYYWSPFILISAG